MPIRRQRLEHRREVAARGRGDRHDRGMAFDVVSTAAVVPDDPPPLRGPASGFAHQVAAVGADDQVGMDERVERAADPGARPLVVEHHEFGPDVLRSDPNATGAPDIRHCLLQTGTRERSLERVAPGER